MFFSISPAADPRFPCHDSLGQWVFSHDDGWSHHQGKWSKGIRNPDQTGNWAGLQWIDSRLYLDHGAWRSFPLWWDEGSRTLTNLLGTGQPVWANTQVYLDAGGLHTVPFDPVGQISQEILTPDQAADMICDRLVQQVQRLPSQCVDRPCRLFLTGGIDTLMIFSAFKHAQVPVDVIDYEHLEYDWFLDQNLQEIKNRHWAYRQIHHWTRPTVLVTGGCGDESMLRGPSTLALWAAWHDLDVSSMLLSRNGYHVHYFTQPKNIQIFQEHWQQREQIQETYTTAQDLYQQIMDINLNDHQHWHLGHTLTWTPLLDLEMTKILLRLDQDSVIEQMIDADLSKRVVGKLFEPALALLSPSKNYRSRSLLHQIKSWTQ
jgi:hypothetical protein